jgi:hypothetical protein
LNKNSTVNHWSPPKKVGKERISSCSSGSEEQAHGICRSVRSSRCWSHSRVSIGIRCPRSPEKRWLTLRIDCLLLLLSSHHVRVHRLRAWCYNQEY